MQFAVFLTDDAARDLEDIYEYIALHDAPGKAEHVLKHISEALARLADSPQRGSITKELLALGIRDYREVFFKPYRIIYKVVDSSVYVFLIVDGRRDMRSLLQRRLLEA